MSRRKAAAAQDAEADVAAPVVSPAAAAAATEEPRAARRGRAAAAEEAAPAAHVDPAAGESVAAAPAARARRVATNVTAEKTAESGVSGTAATATAFAAVDYDAMTYDEFLVHLKQRSKRDTIANLNQRQDENDSKRTGDQDVEPFTDGNGGYSYHALLERVYEELRAKNPSLSSTEARNQIPVPLIERYGSKKTAVSNFKAICEAINRTMEEVKDYLDKELSTTGSIDSSNCLILKLQNVKSIQFEGIIIKYIDEFVKCHSCKKINSSLQKEDRITVLKCNLCQASRTVTSGGNAFHAVMGKRSKLRAANAL